MLVRQSKYDAMQMRAIKAEAKASAVMSQLVNLSVKWGALVDQINAKGGEHFLKNGTVHPVLTKEDATKLIMLCHPDKHDGKPMATEMTQKLLALKTELTKAKP